jgi:hypothetical protein
MKRKDVPTVPRLFAQQHFPDWHFGQHCKKSYARKKLVTTMTIKREGLGKSTALIFADFRRLSVAV